MFDKSAQRRNHRQLVRVAESLPGGAIAWAFRQHLTDPKAAAIPAKLADVTCHLPRRCSTTAIPARMKPGLLLLATDERETDVHRRNAGRLASLSAILDLGDEVKRMAFIDVYRRLVASPSNRPNGALDADPRILHCGFSAYKRR